MTQEQVEALRMDIELLARGAAPLVALLGPQAVAGLIVGQAIARQVPGLILLAENILAGRPPTAEEKAQFAAELREMADANLP